MGPQFAATCRDLTFKAGRLQQKLNGVSDAEAEKNINGLSDHK